MHQVILDKLDDLRAICKRRNVVRLDAFGSSTRDAFEPARSDLDFLVEFGPLGPVEHAHGFFGLHEDIERLFERPVDLVEPAAIRNPFFRQAVQATRLPLYAAS